MPSEAPVTTKREETRVRQSDSNTWFCLLQITILNTRGAVNHANKPPPALSQMDLLTALFVYTPAHFVLTRCTKTVRSSADNIFAENRNKLLVSNTPPKF